MTMMAGGESAGAVSFSLNPFYFTGQRRYAVYDLSRAICPGDVNLDGTVGDADLSLVFSHWGQAAGWVEGDLSGDFLVNDLDMSIVLANWGQTGGIPAAAPRILDYVARTYRPDLGRFCQRDPAEFADTYNLFEYALSRPTVMTDGNRRAKRAHLGGIIGA